MPDRWKRNEDRWKKMKTGGKKREPLKGVCVPNEGKNVRVKYIHMICTGRNPIAHFGREDSTKGEIKSREIYPSINHILGILEKNNNRKGFNHLLLAKS